MGYAKIKQLNLSSNRSIFNKLFQYTKLKFAPGLTVARTGFSECQKFKNLINLFCFSE